MAKQIAVKATYMRGGTSKGTFFTRDDLPEFAKQPGTQRDNFLLRVVGSPDPYAKHTDGMGGATSSTSKIVILDKPSVPDHDVDYLFGQVAIDKAFVDWSGNCGNLTAAVGAFAIHSGIVDGSQGAVTGFVDVRIWQANIHQTIVARVPVDEDGQVIECGNFMLDGVAFASAEVSVSFLNPAEGVALFPTGNVADLLVVPEIGEFEVTYINAGIPTVFLNADALGYDGTEGQDLINASPDVLAKFETIRAYAAVEMGLISNVCEAQTRQHTPKIAFVAHAKTYQASSGKQIQDDEFDINVRALSMGKLHHAMMGTAAVAIATAAAIPGTVVCNANPKGATTSLVFGHPSGTLKVGARVRQNDKQWLVDQVDMGRSARRIMVGEVFVPEDQI